MPHRIFARLGVPAALIKPLCAVTHFTAPTALGISGGMGVVQLVPWEHPYAAFVLASAAIQLLIALLRAWFGERKEVIETLTRQIEDQEKRFVRRLAEDTIIRHEQANQLQLYMWQVYRTQNGLPLDNPPHALYDVDGERSMLRADDAMEIHRSKTP